MIVSSRDPFFLQSVSYSIANRVVPGLPLTLASPSRENEAGFAEIAYFSDHQLAVFTWEAPCSPRERV